MLREKKQPGKYMSHPMPGEDDTCEYCGRYEDSCECPADREQPEPDPDNNKLNK